MPLWLVVGAECEGRSRGGGAHAESGELSGAMRWARMVRIIILMLVYCDTDYENNYSVSH